MDPITIALAVAGSAVKAFGAVKAGAASYENSLRQAEGYDTQLEVSDVNAGIQRRNAGQQNFAADILTTQADVADLGVDFAWSKARNNIAKVQDQGREVLAAQRSSFAAGNLDPTFGSPLLAQAITAGRIAADVDIIEAGAAIEAADAVTRAANIRFSAAGQRANAATSLNNELGIDLNKKVLLQSKLSALKKGEADLDAGYIGAASAFLQGASSLSGGFSGGGSSGGTASTIQVGSQSFPAFV